MEKQVLGKGLSALFSEKNVDMDSINNISRNAEAALYIDINSISVNPNQPRQIYDEEKLNELTESIKTNGIIQPLTVKYSRENNSYILLSGERRLRAAKKAGLSEVPVFNYERAADKEEEKHLIALLENIQRDDLNAMDLSDAFQRTMEDFNLTQEELAAKINKNRSTIGNYLRLQNLPAEIKVYLRKGELQEGHARTLSRLSTPDDMKKLAKRIIEEKLSVRQLEEITKSQAKFVKKKRTLNKDIKHQYLEHIEEKMRNFFGTKVKMNPGPKEKGTIVIEYYSNNDLDRIIELCEKN
ncbi:ParB/RepB/Spo0J family partition protein [soil metagenome]